jgi:hypothetical protein
MSEKWIYLNDGSKVHISWIDTEFEEVKDEEE